MLIELYFPHLRQWLWSINRHEIDVRQKMAQHSRRDVEGPIRLEDSVSVVNAALMAYSKAAHAMTDELRAESRKLDEMRWFHRPRLTPADFAQN
ncbi:MAG: hypothetical protein C0485_19295 [Pirellula sp.]|nr:hypothetical protein [Pirellula sp.]